MRPSPPTVHSITPPDLQPPEYGEPAIEGWTVNGYLVARGEISAVRRQWSTSMAHGDYDRNGRRYSHGSQGRRPLYSTEALALEAAAAFARAHGEYVASVFETRARRVR